MKCPQFDAEKEVRCPFYAWHEKLSVNCEGIGEAANLTMLFRSAPKREGYMLSRCAERYKKCPVYILLMEQKYPDA